MSQQKKASNSTLEYVIVIISTFIMFFFGRIVGPFSCVTDVGANIIGVFIGVILMTVFTHQTFFATVMGMLALITGGYISSSDAMSTWLGTGTVPQFIFINSLCLALKECGVIDIIVKKLVCAKALHGRPKLFLCVLYTASFIAAMFVGFIPVCILMFSVFESIRDMVGYEKKSATSRYLLLTLYMSCMGSFALPIKGIQLTVIGMINKGMEPYGLVFHNSTYLILEIAVTLVTLYIFTLIAEKVYKCDFKPLKNLDVSNVESLQKIADKLNRRQIIVTVVFVLSIAYLISLSFVSKTAAWYEAYSKIGNTWIFVGAIAFLNVIKVDGKPVVNANMALRDGAMWNIICLIGCFSMLGSAMSSADFGVRQWIMNLVSPIFGNMGLLGILILIGVVITIATNFCNGLPLVLACNAAVMPFVCEMELASGISASAIGTMLNLCANMAFLTYAGTIYASLILDREEFDQKWIWSKGILILPLYIIVCIVLCGIGCYILP